MTNGAVQVASGVVEGLKQQPTLLVIVVLNVLTLGAGIWLVSRVSDASQKEREWQRHLIEQCYPSREKT